MKIREAKTGRVLLRQKRVNAFNLPYTANPTINCLYGCRYCYLAQARWLKGEFAEWMKIKQGYIPKLKRELEALRHLPLDKRRVQVGPACEVYHPVAMRAMQTDATTGLMSRVLDAFVAEQDAGWPWAVHIVTKSNLVLGDLDRIKRLACAQVEITLTTLDERAKLFWEGKAPSVAVRLDTIARLSEAGVFVRAMAMPLFSMSGDEAERRSAGERLWDAVRARGARAFKMKGLNYFDPQRLADGDKGRVKGRCEDPAREKLIRSGEQLPDGRMDFGYAQTAPWLAFETCA